MGLKTDTRKTKMIWSLTADMLSDQVMKSLPESKADVLRLVYDAQQAEKLADFVRRLRKDQSPAANFPVMLDIATYGRAWVKSPSDDRRIEYGDRLTLTPIGGGGDIEVQGESFDTLFRSGSAVYLGFGGAILEVKSMTSKSVTLETVQGGIVFAGMEIQVPDTRTHPTLDTKNYPALENLLDAGVEFLVVHGAHETADVGKFRSDLKKRYGEASPWLIAKIDDEQSIQNIDSILEVVEGTLVSRREMAVLVNPATVPMVTKEITQICNDRGKIVVTASEMLASMRHHVTPTRAEVSDIANAVIDGTDAVVLSEDVSLGNYAQKALAVMDLTIRDIEKSERISKPNWRKQRPSVQDSMDAIAYNAYRTGQRVKARALVCITHEGNTALRLGSYQAPVPIIAVTFSHRVQRRLELVRGVQVLTMEQDPTIDNVLQVVNDKLVTDSWLKAGDRIVFVSITLSSIGREASNLFTVQTLA
jgi:pyruvate kinase